MMMSVSFLWRQFHPHLVQGRALNCNLLDGWMSGWMNTWMDGWSYTREKTWGFVVGKGAQSVRCWAGFWFQPQLWPTNWNWVGCRRGDRTFREPYQAALEQGPNHPKAQSICRMHLTHAGTFPSITAYVAMFILRCVITVCVPSLWES